ncbi:CRISPR-associated endoribonuclease Cas6 [Pseudoflavonifractor phocaeensis]|uniref:CRISPR-associated endoribonuclease Cas6 n=1 Tax=Pseudoflavonifractor phocaeensis TaxID=1870988 RepID=UPI00195DE216|nr:CRISPR-associated endoribonuclease Cas6 [Pseudoflavonifractor phocaeensis]MBM6926833.1 CRISPR-associated endoribonuclease Cas6 [Pseudoflavonifractor phocaeensis]
MIWYQFEATTPEGIVAHSSWGYWLYSALNESVSPEMAEIWHQQISIPFSQYFYPERERNRARWNITVFSEEAENVLLPVLEQRQALFLREPACSLPLRIIEKRAFPSGSDFLDCAAALEDRRRHTIQFWTPTAFKHNETYQIFPDIHQMLQSLVRRWNQLMPEYPLLDEDALRMLETQIWIQDYRLQSRRFDLKGHRVPGFIGTIWVRNRLPAPLLEVWKVLLLFGVYAGVGIKTALGMGGISCPELTNH